MHVRAFLQPAGWKPGSGGSPLPFLLDLGDLQAEFQGLRSILFAQQLSKVMHAVSHLELEDEDCLNSCLRNRAAFEGRIVCQDHDMLEARLMVYTTKTTEILQTFPQEVIISIGAKQLPFQSHKRYSQSNECGEWLR